MMQVGMSELLYGPNLLLLVFTQAFQKLSIKTLKNMLQVTLLTISAISIDNEASDLWLLANFVLFWFKKTNFMFFSDFGQMTNKRQIRCTYMYHH